MFVESRRLMNIKLPLKEILPNPFRNRKHYEIQEEKIDELINSYKVSGYWPIIIVRKNADGRYERAFGEHRSEAYARLFGKDAEIDVIVMKLSDDAMLKMMANENSPTWSTAFLNDMNTVESTVKAFAEGRIKLPEQKMIERTIHLVRLGPSFIRGQQRNCSEFSEQSKRVAYSAQTIGEYLGWMMPKGKAQDRVYHSLGALELIEKGQLRRNDFIGMGLTTARAFLKENRAIDEFAESAELSKQNRAHELEEQANRIEKSDKQEAEAMRKEAAQKRREVKQTAEKIRAEVPAKVREALKTGKAGHAKHSVRSVTIEEVSKIDKEPKKKLPDIDDLARKLAKEIVHFLSPFEQNERSRQLEAIITHQRDLDHEEHANLKGCLEELARIATAFANRLDAKELKQATLNSARKALTA